MKTTAALLLIVISVLYFGYGSRQEQLVQRAALDEACRAERDQVNATGANALPAKRMLACISWQDPKEPDIHTPRG